MDPSEFLCYKLDELLNKDIKELLLSYLVELS